MIHIQCFGQQCHKELTQGEIDHLAHRCAECYDITRTPDAYIKTASKLLGADKVAILLEDAIYQAGEGERVALATAAAVIEAGEAKDQDWTLTKAKLGL